MAERKPSRAAPKAAERPGAPAPATPQELEFVVNKVGPADQVPKILIDAIRMLVAEVSQLRVKIEDLSANVAALGLPADNQRAAKRAPRRRAITDSDANAAIKAYFEERHGETVYPSEIADELRLDYDRTLRLIGELESDGQVTKA